jgi:alkylated DNA repair protein alkB homolog 1
VPCRGKARAPASRLSPKQPPTSHTPHYTTPHHTTPRTRTGHVDDAEGALTHPVVSFSLGLAAIFLLGGPTKETDPIPLLLCSGGCLVMGGASRLCVHGVPAILTDAALPPKLLQSAGLLLASRFWEGWGGEGQQGGEEAEEEEPCSEAEATLLARYLATSRVNFNLRQVWPSEGEGNGDGEE